MSKMSAVDQYLKLDGRIHAAETKVEEFTQRLETDKWEQCRVVHEAITSGGFSRVSFAKAVGVNDKTIGTKFRVWEKHGSESPPRRPPFTEANAAAMGKRSGAEGTADRDAQGIRKATAEDLIEHASPAEIAKAAADPDVARAIARNDEAREAVEEQAIEHRARHGLDETNAKAKKQGEKTKGDIHRAFGSDVASSSLHQAASFIAGAIYERDIHGIEFPDIEEEAIAEVERAINLYRHHREASTITDADRAFLDGLGITAQEGT